MSLPIFKYNPSIVSFISLQHLDCFKEFSMFKAFKALEDLQGVCSCKDIQGVCYGPSCGPYLTPMDQLGARRFADMLCRCVLHPAAGLCTLA
jgi:hypothetical protein